MSDLVNVNSRLPRPMLERLDALLPAVSEAPELAMVVTVRRSDVIRLALLRGIRQLEAEYAGQPSLPGVGT